MPKLGLRATLLAASVLLGTALPAPLAHASTTAPTLAGRLAEVRAAYDPDGFFTSASTASTIKGHGTH
jgi:hypothetical protein